TTMIGFGSLMVADYQGIYSLGLVLTLGVGCCLLASITLLPAMLKLCAAKGWDL
ncbi:MAG: MMPL family transporter, partial [Nitrospina sp.]|nr:MMPL family transporter [Nitrospina sp.]